MKVQVSGEIVNHCREVTLGMLYVEPIQGASFHQLHILADQVCDRAVAACRDVYAGSWADKGTLRSVRELHRLLGRSPSRYRPSSEALIRRILKDEEMPRLNPVVDISNAFSAIYGLPIGVYSAEALRGEIELRLGKEGEFLYSLRRAEMDISGFPVLVDRAGIFGSTYSDSVRTAYKGQGLDGGAALIVVYGFAEKEATRECVDEIAQTISTAQVSDVAVRVHSVADATTNGDQ